MSDEGKKLRATRLRSGDGTLDEPRNNCDFERTPTAARWFGFCWPLSAVAGLPW